MAAALIDLWRSAQAILLLRLLRGLTSGHGDRWRGSSGLASNDFWTRYYDNCRSSIETFNDTIKRTGIDPKMVQVVEGFFEQSLPGFGTTGLVSRCCVWNGRSGHRNRR